MNDAAVVDDTENHRFLIRVRGEHAELVYRRNGARMVLVHTAVPEALGGQGLGARLVATAVERARSENLTLVPLCPYARRWLQRHPAEAVGVQVDWPSQEHDES